MSESDFSSAELWSGIPFYLTSEMSMQQGISLNEFVDLRPKIFSTSISFKRFYYNFLLRRGKGVFRIDKEEDYLKKFASNALDDITKFRPDFILSFWPHLLAHLETDIPKFVYTDATIDLLTRHYPSYSDFCSESKEKGILSEEVGLRKAKKIFYPSEWAKKSAVEKYGIDSSKIELLPFGANFIDQKKYCRKAPPTYEVCNLLFVGYDTARKGLDKAIILNRALNSQGINSKLRVVGKVDWVANDRQIILEGVLSKQNKNDVEKMELLFSEAHFFILPTKIDAFGIVFCEASCFGLPSFTHNVGGVSSAINELNGVLFHEDDPIDDWVERILFFIENPLKYSALSVSSYEEYINRLNWKSTARKILNSICELI